ncbi:MAG: RdgB/HAM1 family non-canonical purine NTP pyrophosphatase [Oscillospiraceae bacterium]|nr:RdgB/HAM1 family non-canonical purine NTP pyrophosphatase [Oscillospiraceae bacterium]
MKFVLASQNPKKLLELRAILSAEGVEIISREEAGVTVDPEETGETFEENAVIKARAVMEASGLPALADDSGLVVDALGGAPGVRSARYTGDHNDSDEARYLLLLENMRDVKQRSAKFVSYAAAVFPNGDVITACGECRGSIAHAPRGSGGFGYDPVFMMPDGRMMSELSPDEKNAVSHRAAALTALKKKLTEYMNDADK